MLRIVLAVSLAAFSASADVRPLSLGIERRASAPSRSVNDGYPVGGAVTGDGFTVALQTGLFVRTAQFAPLATQPNADSEPMVISRFNKMSGLPNGIVTAWVDERYRDLSASVSRKAGDLTVARELPVLGEWGSEVDSVTTNRTNALVLSRDSYERLPVWASVLDANGIAAGPPIEIVPRSTDRALGITVASDPAGFLVLHHDEKGLTLFATRITNSGTATKFTVRLQAPVTATFAAFDGTKYLIALQQGSAVRGFLMPVTGTPRSETFLIDANARVVAMVSRPGGSLFVAFDRVFVFDHATRTHGADYPMPLAANLVLSDGRYALLAFANHPDFPVGTGTGQWFDVQNGQPLGAPFALSYGSPMQTQPAIAMGDGVDLLLWAERDPLTLKDAIRGTRIARDGHALDEPSLRFSLPDTWNTRPAAAFNGREFIVAWHEQIGIPGQSSDQRVRVQRLTRDGRLLDSVPRDIGTARVWTELEVAHSADTTLVLWIGRVGDVYQVHGKRMNRDGALLDATPIRLTESKAPWHYAMDLAAGTAEGAGTFVVAWMERFSGEIPTLHYALLDTTGKVVTQKLLHTVNESSVYPPLVAWNGSVYVVVWGGQATLLTRVGWPYPTKSMDVGGVYELGAMGESWYVIYGDAFYGPGGHALMQWGNYWLEADAPLDQKEIAYPRIASDGKRTILAYARPIRESQHGDSYRVIYRLQRDPAPPERRRTSRH